MEKFDPIDVEFLINEPQVKKDSDRVKKHLRGIAQEAEDVSSDVNQQISGGLKNADIEVNKTTASIARQGRQWNSLGNSINQVTRELPNFAFNAQTGFLAISNNIPILADEIARLRVQNTALAAEGKATIPVWRQVASGLFSWNTVLTLGVTLLTVYGGKLVTLISNLVKTKDELDATKKAQEALNKAFESTEYIKAIQNVNDLQASIKLAKDGLLDKDDVLKEYNKTLGLTTGEVETLDQAEKELIKNAPAYIEMTLYKAAAAQSSADAAKALAESAQRQLEIEQEIADKQVELEEARRKGVGSSKQAQGIFTNIEETAAQGRISTLQTEINELIEEQNKLQEDAVNVFTKLSGKAAEIAKAYGFDLTPGGDSDSPEILKQRKSLLERLAALDAEYSRKQFDRDEQELQALRDKFDKVRRLVEEFNQDPKNANVQIDLSGLEELQRVSEADLQFKQQTRALKEELQEQERLFKDFEEAKKQFGIEKAREMYQGQLGEFDTYAEYLRSRIAENEDSYAAVAENYATGAQAERVRLLDQELAAANRAQRDKYNDLLASLQSYEERRNRILSDYQVQRNQLLAEGAVSAAEELKKQVKNELDALDEAFAKETDEYKALMRGVEGLSETAARSVVENARRMVNALLAAGQLSEEVAQEINQKINALEEDIDSDASDKLQKIANDIYAISDAFQRLGDEVSYFDQGLGDTISTIGELGQVAGDAVQAYTKFSTGDIVGGFTSAINAITGIFSIGRRARESARKARAEILRLQQLAEDGERRLNALQRERNIALAEEVELSLKNIQARREALKLAQEQLRQDERLLLQELRNEQYIASSRTEKYGGFLGIGRKTKVVNEYADLLGLTFEEIERLYERGQLTDRAKELFEQLRQLREEGEDINRLLGDLEGQANELFTGTTSDAIADSIIEGLKRGYDSFEDFAGDIERILQQAIFNSIKYQLLEEPLQRLFEEFAAFAESEGELSEREVQAIRDSYNAQVQAALDRYNQLTDVLDLDELDTGTQQRGLQGAIRRELTETTASELTGLFRGQFDITKQHFQLDERRFLLEEKGYSAMIDMLTATARIEANTAATVTELQLAVVELKGINKNTEKPGGGSARDIGR